MGLLSVPIFGPTLAAILLLAGHLPESSRWLPGGSFLSHVPSFTPLLVESSFYVVPCSSPGGPESQSAVGGRVRIGRAETLSQRVQVGTAGVLPTTKGNMEPDPCSLNIPNHSRSHNSTVLPEGHFDSY